MHASDPSGNWLARVVTGLSSDGYSIARDVTFEDHEFLVVAHFSVFKLTKFGNWETFFIFREFEDLTGEDVRGFSSLALKYAIEARALRLPLGLFEGISCFAVCITGSLSEVTAEGVRHDTPPRHWSAAEIPVVFDHASNQVLVFEGTPLWGAAYYQGFRNLVQKYLVFH